MIDQSKDVTNVDDLLRRACADDLPRDVAAAMSRQIEAFSAEAPAGRRTLLSRAWPLPRTAWAALSILMLVAGILLQGARAPSPLADRISSLKTASANLQPTRR